MKKLLLFIATCLSLGATTLTGSIKLPNGTGLTGFIMFSLGQQASLVSTGGCGGPAQLVPTVIVQFTVTNGTMAGTPTLYGNDCMNPQGVYYNVQEVDTNGNVLMTDRWQISGSSIDVGTIISVTIQGTTQTLGSTGVVLFNPTGNQTINQPPGSALITNFQTVTGTLVFPNGASCTAAGCVGLVGPGGANTQLSNLSSTAINGDLLPNATNTRNLGSTVDYWSTSYLHNILSNDIEAQNVGSSTIGTTSLFGMIQAANINIGAVGYGGSTGLNFVNLFMQEVDNASGSGTKDLFVGANSTTGGAFYSSGSFAYTMGSNNHPWSKVYGTTFYAGGVGSTVAGFSGTKTAGSCVLTISGGIITGVSGC